MKQLNLLKSPEARLIVHTVLMWAGVCLTLWVKAGKPVDKAAIIALVPAAIRALIGLVTSTNPQVGKNIV